MRLRSNIPWNVVAYVGGTNDKKSRTYALFMNGHLLVIQASKLMPPDFPDTYLDIARSEELDKEYQYDLEKIHCLLNSIEWGKTNWAYLVPTSNGGCTLSYKERVLYKISCPPWAPLVDERDIETTLWDQCESRQGIWKGKDVDLFIGWEDDWLRRIDLTMRGRKAVQGMDISFEVLGHVVRDNAIIGIMTEPVRGRRLRFYDRALVYDTVSRLLQRGIYLPHIPKQCIVMCDGKVRLLHFQHFEYFTESDRPKMAQREKRLWNNMDRLFAEVEVNPECLEPIYMTQCYKILPNYGSPERPRFITLRIKSEFLNQEFKTLRKQLDTKDKDRSSKDRSVVPLAPRSKAVYIVEISADPEQDVPLHGNTLRFHKARSSRQIPHPYGRLQTAPRRLLLGSDDSDRTSDNEKSTRGGPDIAASP